MSVLSVRVRAAASERRELVQALLGWLASARQSTGFVRGHVSEDLEVPGAYLLSSAWHQREAMEAHVVGPDFGVLLGALDVLGRETNLILTAAAEGAEDGWSHVWRLRRHARRLHEQVDGVASGRAAACG